MEEKKEEKKASSHQKGEAPDPAKGKAAEKSANWFFRIFVMAAVVIALWVDVYPKFAAMSWAIPSVAPAASANQSKEEEKKVEVPLLGDRWSEAYANLDSVPVGTKFRFDGPEDAVVLWSDGTTSPLYVNDPKQHGVRHGIVRFWGPAGDHVTVCFGSGCKPESRPPKYDLSHMGPEIRPRWKVTPWSIEHGHEHEGDYPKQDDPPAEEDRRDL